MKPRSLLALLFACAALQAPAGEREIDTVLARLLALDLRPVAGFNARVLVPPGELYDPLVMHPLGDQVPAFHT